MADELPLASPDDQKHDDPKQIDQVNTPQPSTESALQKFTTEVTKPINNKLPSYIERHEKNRRQLNKTITQYAQNARRMGKKKYEVEANVNQLFETINQEMHNQNMSMWYRTFRS